MLARTARLSESAQTLLDAAAIVPGRAELWLLTAMTQFAAAELEECLSTGVLTPEQNGVAFRHELARLAIEESLPPNRRIAFHSSALAALVCPPGGAPDVVRLAHHAEAAEDAEAVLRYAPVAAARAASMGAHQEAASLYGRAARFEHEPSARAELLDGQAQEAYLTGDFAEAFEACSEALVSHRAAGRLRKEAASLLLHSRLLWFFGRDDAIVEGQSAVALLETFPPDHELGLAYARLSELAWKCGDAEQALAWGRRAIELARQIDDPEVASYAAVCISAIEALQGEPASSAELERALEDAIDAGFEEVAANAFDFLIAAAVHSRNFAAVERYLTRGIDYCSERDLGTWRQHLVALGARSDLDHGRWDDAAAGAARVLQTARTQGTAPALARSVLALVRARRGDPGVNDALDYETQRDDASAGSLQPAAAPPPMSKAYLAAARAEIAWLKSDPAAVVAATEEALDAAVRSPPSWIVGELACWRWRAGHEEETALDVPEPYALQIRGEWARQRCLDRDGLPACGGPRARGSKRGGAATSSAGGTPAVRGTTRGGDRGPQVARAWRARAAPRPAGGNAVKPGGLDGEGAGGPCPARGRFAQRRDR